MYITQWVRQYRPGCLCPALLPEIPSMFTLQSWVLLTHVVRSQSKNISCEQKSCHFSGFVVKNLLSSKPYINFIIVRKGYLYSFLWLSTNIAHFKLNPLRTVRTYTSIKMFAELTIQLLLIAILQHHCVLLKHWGAL